MTYSPFATRSCTLVQMNCILKIEITERSNLFNSFTAQVGHERSVSRQIGHRFGFSWNRLKIFMKKHYEWALKKLWNCSNPNKKSRWYRLTLYRKTLYSSSRIFKQRFTLPDNLEIRNPWRYRREAEYTFQLTKWNSLGFHRGPPVVWFRENPSEAMLLYATNIWEPVQNADSVINCLIRPIVFLLTKSLCLKRWYMTGMKGGKRK